MRTTAKDIARCAELREAQGALPQLIRRLAMQNETSTQLAFPAGDFISRHNAIDAVRKLTTSYRGSGPIRYHRKILDIRRSEVAIDVSCWIHCGQ